MQSLPWRSLQLKVRESGDMHRLPSIPPHQASRGPEGGSVHSFVTDIMGISE